MSDKSKPKPGSLRDRIAAFEGANSTTIPGPSSPSVPRPKPNPISWKPRPPSPIESPTKASEELTGLSVSDARDSIIKAGSLRDRMAALKEKGAFGAPTPPPVVPKPASDRPKWRPPPPVVSPSEDLTQPHHESIPSPGAPHPVTGPRSPCAAEEIVSSSADHVTSSQPEGLASQEAEDERQRRAAIAARMARIGGARVGMMPPVFSRKQSVPEPVEEVSPKQEDPSTAAENDPRITSPSPAPHPIEPESRDDITSRKSEEDTSIHSLDAPSVPTRAPPAMPVPAVPRRTAPPRKKTPKSSSLTPEEPSAHPTQDRHQDSDPDEKKDVLDSTIIDEPADFQIGYVGAAGATEIAVTHADVPGDDKHVSSGALIGAHVAVPRDSDAMDSVEPEHVASERQDEGMAAPAVTSTSASPDNAQSAEEEDVAERQRLVADRFTPPPRRQSSGVTADESGAESIADVSASTVPQEDESADVTQSTIYNVETPDAEKNDTPAEISEVDDGDSEEEQDESSADRTLGRAREVDDVQGSDEREEEEEDFNLPVYRDDDMIEASGAELVDDVDEGDHSLDDDTSVLQDEEDDEVQDGDDDEAAQFPIPPPIPMPVLNIPPPPPRLDPHRHTAPPTRPPPPPSIEGISPRSPMSVPSPPIRFVQPPPPPLLGHERLRVENESGHAPFPGPTRSVPPPSPPPSHPHVETYLSEERMDPPPPIPPRFVPPPPPPLLPSQMVDEQEDGEDGLSDHEHELEGDEDHIQELDAPVTPPPPPPRPPRRVPRLPDDPGQKAEGDEVLPTPPRLLSHQPQSDETHEHTPNILTIASPPVPKKPPQRPSRSPPVPSQTRPSIADNQPHESDSQHHEVLDESEGDPIDPAFHSPSRRASTIINTSPVILPSTSQIDPDVGRAAAAVPSDEGSAKATEEPGAGRPKTIAERMAKLGGIKFGGPIPVGVLGTPTFPHMDEGAANTPEEKKEREDEEEEEEERARKERIAARMAGLGGMRLGMMPFGVGAMHVKREDSGEMELPVPSQLRSRPPPRLVPPPPPPPAAVQDVDSEQESMTNSEDGVKVEAEDSEMEEVKYEDVLEQEDEEEAELVPPPIPSRVGRPPLMMVSPIAKEDVPTKRLSQAPPVPVGRPPVPVAPPIRRQSASATATIARKASADGQQSVASHGGPSYVMVEEPIVLESEEPLSSSPPLPPPLGTRPTSRVVRPTRAAPPPPTTAGSAKSQDSLGEQWELPSIPSSALESGEDSEDLSASIWTELSHSGTLNAPEPATKRASMSQQARKTSMAATGEVTMTAEELMVTWGRVGVQMCEAATTLFEQSKRGLIGDGTYQGFVDAVVKQVPNAVMPAPPGYGYLIYMQNGTTVQKRASEIMPGDVVVLSDAKFKGHKGLQTYTQNVGVGEPVVGIVNEFEAKKSKIRVFEANQHVGQQTVASVSYRLDDLKSGTVKVFRVLDGAV